MREIITHTLFDSTARYYVVRTEDGRVLVEVIEAPGLEAEERFWFTKEAVDAMRDQGPRPGLLRRVRTWMTTMPDPHCEGTPDRGPR